MEATFAVRIVNVDVVSAPPVAGLDPEWCSFESRPVKRVPVIRIFGSTPLGQKCCVHVHNTLPYFFLDYPTGDLVGVHEGEAITTKEKVYAYIHRLFSSIEVAMDLSLGARERGQYIHDIQIVRGKPFYGFALGEKFYLKIFLYNPFLLNRMVTLLRNGGVMQTHFQPYEAHIPYLLQFFVDYNLFGMGYVRFSQVKFRPPFPESKVHRRHWRNIQYDVGAPASRTSGGWSQRSSGSQRDPIKYYCAVTITDDQISPIVDRRETTCELEVDALAEDIVNYFDRVGTPSSTENQKLVTSLAVLWEDEQQRRRQEGSSGVETSFLEIGVDDRAMPPETLLAQETKKKLQRIINEERKQLDLESAVLKPVPGRDLSFSTSQKQQIMSQGPLRQCPDLLPEPAPGSGVNDSGAGGSSSPASLFPNTPRANLRFNEMQKQAIPRPERSEISRLAEKDLFEPSVDHELVMSQAAAGSFDDEMVDILNWMQGESPNATQDKRRGMDHAAPMSPSQRVQAARAAARVNPEDLADMDVFDADSDLDEISEAKEIEQSQIELRDIMLEAVEKNNNNKNDLSQEEQEIIEAINNSQHEEEDLYPAQQQQQSEQTVFVSPTVPVTVSPQANVPAAAPLPSAIDEMDMDYDVFEDHPSPESPVARSADPTLRPIVFEDDEEEKENPPVPAQEDAQSHPFFSAAPQSVVQQGSEMILPVSVAENSGIQMTPFPDRAARRVLVGHTPTPIAMETAVTIANPPQDRDLRSHDIKAQLAKKPLKSALKKPNSASKSKSKFKSPSTTEDKKKPKTSPAAEEEDEIVFTQPHQFGSKKSSKKRKERSELSHSALPGPKRVKFEQNVSVYTLAPESLGFTDKSNVAIIFDDDEEPIVKPIQSNPPAAAPAPEPTLSRAPPVKLSHRSSSSGLLAQPLDLNDSIVQSNVFLEPFCPPASPPVKPEPKAIRAIPESPHILSPPAVPGTVLPIPGPPDAVPEPQPVAENFEVPEDEEEDMLQVEMIKASQQQSGFHWPRPSPTQKSAPQQKDMPPPAPARPYLDSPHPTRVMPRLYYEADDDDDELEKGPSAHIDLSLHEPISRQLDFDVKGSKTGLDAAEIRPVVADAVEIPQPPAPEPAPPLSQEPSLSGQIEITEENSLGSLHTNDVLSQPESVRNDEVDDVQRQTPKIVLSEADSEILNNSQREEIAPPGGARMPLISPIKRVDLSLAVSLPTEQQVVEKESPNASKLSPQMLVSPVKSPRKTPPSTQEEQLQRLRAAGPGPYVLTDSNLKLRVYAFYKKPPSLSLIKKGLEQIGKPFLQYQEPFFGIPDDATKYNNPNQPREKYFGMKGSDIQSYTLDLIPEFGSDPLVSANPKATASSSKSYRSVPLCPVLGPTGKNLRILTPARPPPPRSVVLQLLPTKPVVESAPTTPPVQKDEGDIDALPASPVAWPGMPKVVSAPQRVVTPQKITPNSKKKRMIEASQIEQNTPDNSFGFLFSQGFEQTIASDSGHENENLTLISIEIHVNTRGDLRPDPKLDTVNAIYLSIRDQSMIKAAGALYRDQLILLKLRAGSAVQEAAEADTTRRTLDGLTVPKYLRNEYNSEEDLFEGLIQLVIKYDPDMILGYEIQSSSLGYLLDRAQVLRIDLAQRLSRLSPDLHKSMAGQNYFDKEKDPWGFTHGSGIHIAGRTVVNIWRILRSEIKSTSYTFENVVFHVLHARMPMYTFKTLTQFYQGASPSQWRTHLYWFERVQCDFYLLDALNVIGRTSEMARLYGITFFEVLSRGSQFRVESLVMRLTKPHNYILLSPSKQQVAAQLAPECIPLVLEPQSGFYQDPLLVLDFQSLYPSIIIAYNYCYSTCLGRVAPGVGPTNMKKFGASHISLPHGALEHLKDVIHTSPNEVMFLKPEVQVGILPRMLVEILETRVMVKNAMKRAKKDRARYRTLDARQLALKLLANVTYGYTSASFSGRMPCVDIADSIVQTGRETLERAIRTVNSHPTWHARVVYGDTDSMFVLVEGATRERAFEVGHEIAETVSKMNPWPVKLKFEKMYLPSLLLAKKRYVGYMYESKEQLDAVFDAKGIETVRRDSCPAVAKIMQKAITLLFEKRDLSEIRTYVQRQFQKMLSGRTNLSDFIFRKEVRLGTYAPGKPAPPAALVSTKEMAKDPRAEPQYGERVPYIVAAGHHMSRLIDLVYHPDYFLKYPEKLRPNANYYITKQVIPSLARIFSLIGVDVASWYAMMPKNVRLLQQLENPTLSAAARSRIDQYYLSQHCPVCDELTRKGLCEQCSANKQSTAYILTVRLRHLQQQQQHLSEICMNCQGTRVPQIDCTSLDCPVLFERSKTALTARSVASYVNSLDK